MTNKTGGIVCKLKSNQKSLNEKSTNCLEEPLYASQSVVFGINLPFMFHWNIDHGNTLWFCWILGIQLSSFFDPVTFILCLILHRRSSSRRSKEIVEKGSLQSVTWSCVFWFFDPAVELYDFRASDRWSYNSYSCSLWFRSVESYSLIPGVTTFVYCQRFVIAGSGSIQLRLEMFQIIVFITDSLPI